MALQLSHHKAFQRREWTAQRVGWAGMALFVLAALLGLLGPGPLSWATATGDDGLVEVEYQRFTHIEADDMITIVLDPAVVTGESVQVELAEDWVRSVDINGIIPAPKEQVATDYGLRLTVSAEPGSEVAIQIAFRPSALGTVNGGIRFQGETVPFGQLTYP